MVLEHHYSSDPSIGPSALLLAGVTAAQTSLWRWQWMEKQQE